MAKLPTEVTESVVVPVPWPLQSLGESYVKGEATEAARGYLANVAQRLGGAKA